MLATAALFASLFASACDDTNHSRTLKLVEIYTDSPVVRDSCVSIVINRQDAVEKLLPELRYLPELESLELIKVRLSAADLEAIAKSHVRQLAIEYCDVKAETLKSLAQLNDLRSLTVINGGITDQSMAVFGEFRRLEKLNLSLNPLTGPGFESLAECTGLRQLILSGTQLSNDSIPFLLPFRRLEQLDIPETAVTSQGIEKLAPLIWLNQIAAPDGVMTVEAAERFRKSRLAAIEAAKMAGSEVPPVDWVPYSVTEGMPHERDSTTSDLVDLQNLMARSAQRAGQVELKLNGWTGELISPTSIGFSEDSEDGISSRQFAWKYVKGAEQMAQFVLTFGHYAGVMGSLPILSEMNREAYPQYRNFGDESRMTLRVGKLNAKIDRVPAERLYSASHAENILFHSTFSVDGIWDADLENSFVRTYLNAPGGNRQERATTLLYRVHMITDRHVSVDAQHEILSEFLAAMSRAMEWNSPPASGD